MGGHKEKEENEEVRDKEEEEEEKEERKGEDEEQEEHEERGGLRRRMRRRRSERFRRRRRRDKDQGGKEKRGVGGEAGQCPPLYQLVGLFSLLALPNRPACSPPTPLPFGRANKQHRKLAGRLETVFGCRPIALFLVQTTCSGS